MKNPLGYETNERVIGTELWTMVQEFYHKYPKYANLDLYIVGESYGEGRDCVSCTVPDVLIGFLVFCDNSCCGSETEY